MNSSSTNQNLEQLKFAQQRFRELASLPLVLRSGLAGELESGILDTTARLEETLANLRRGGEAPGAEMAEAVLELRRNAHSAHLLLEFLANFEQGWSALVSSMRNGYTETGRAAQLAPTAGMSMEA